jgi:hypothetical protein
VTNDAWDEGMALLEANLRDRDLTPGMKSLRGATLRAAMNHLSDEQWGGVVQEALRSPTGWFPVLGELEDYAARLPQATTRTALPDDTRTPEERRTDAVRLLEQIKAAVRDADLPPAPVVSVPREETVIVLKQYPERLDELRRQAAVIKETAPASTGDEGRA